MGTVLLTGTDEDCFLRESLVMSLTTIYIAYSANSVLTGQHVLLHFLIDCLAQYILKQTLFQLFLITGYLNMISFHSCIKCSYLTINCLNFAKRKKRKHFTLQICDG